MSNRYSKVDPVQIVLVCAIFATLFVTTYLMKTNLTIISLIFAAGIMFYQLFSARRGALLTKFQYGKKIPSPFAMIMMALPFVIGSVAAYEGFGIWGSPSKIIILWGMTITFWSTLMFVPLSVYSKYKEDSELPPTKRPSVSILVPAYNEEKVIAKTIEGLLNTRYPDKEIIVIDDGSQDNTLNIMNQYKNKVKVLHKDNGGKASALNYGIAFAKNEIIVIVDADTIISIDALEQIVRGFERDPKVAAVAGNIKVRNRMNWLTWTQALEYVSGIEIIRRAFDFFGSITIVPGALGAFRKSSLEEVGTYHKDTLVEDFDATIKVLKSGFVIQGSTRSTAYTEAPQTFHDFYKQRKRWYRGNLQVLARHWETLFNPRYAFLYKIAFPFMIISMVVLPFAGLVVVGASIYELLIGDWFFILQMFVLFIILQIFMSALAVRIDREDPRLILFSPFLVLGYKQIVDLLLIKGTLETIFKVKAKWTSATRVGV